MAVVLSRYRPVFIPIAIAVFVLFAVTSFLIFDLDNAFSTNCSTRGTYSHFVAGFETDATGSWPTPAPGTIYGPPGADIGITASDPSSVMVVDSTELESKALRLTRGATGPTVIDTIAGIIDGEPHTSGKIFIEYLVHGETVPEHLIAGPAISVRDTNDSQALSMKLFDGSYHLLEGGSYVRMNGSYDPDTKHIVHIELDMDKREYFICIDDEVVVDQKEFSSDSFTNLQSLRLFMPQTITEAFTSVYVVDDIRISKP